MFRLENLRLRKPYLHRSGRLQTAETAETASPTSRICTAVATRFHNQKTTLLKKVFFLFQFVTLAKTSNYQEFEIWPQKHGEDTLKVYIRYSCQKY